MKSETRNEMINKIKGKLTPATMKLALLYIACFVIGYTLGHYVLGPIIAWLS